MNEQKLPNWSAATAPGPDGYQRTVAVPGMPSAARDAALEEACEALHTQLKYPTEARAIVRGLKSMYAPAPVQQAAPGEPAANRSVADIEADLAMGGGLGRTARLIGELKAAKDAAEPAQPAGLSEQEIERLWDAQRKYHGGEPCKAGHLAFARAIEAAIRAAKAAP